MDFPRPAVRSYRAGEESLTLGKDLSRALKTLADSEQASRFMFLAAVLQTLIHRLTGHHDVVIGSTISGRNQPQTAPLIGFFVNVLLLRANFSHAPSFRSLLRQMRSTCLGAYAHQDLPLELLVKELSPERHGNRTPLFQCLINMHNLPNQDPDFPNLTIQRFEAGEDKATYDLELLVSQRDGEICLTLIYATDLFSAERVREMLGQYHHLLKQIVKDPNEQIERYSLVTETAQAILPDPAKPLDRTWRGPVQKFVSGHARRDPDRSAVVDAHGTTTYRELDELSARLANHLLDHGVGSEDVVAIYAHRTTALVWALLGIFKTGAAFMILDPTYPAARLKEYISEGKPTAWLQVEAAGRLAPELEAFVAESSWRCRLTLPSVAEAVAKDVLANCSDQDPPITIGPDQLAYLAFTSGTTGKPKAVLGEHGSLTHFF